MTDGGDVAGVRFGDWKALYMKQDCHGLDVWKCPLVPVRAPLLFNLRQDPYEEAEKESGSYDRWWVDHMFVMAPAAMETMKFLKTFEAYPPRQVPGDWTIATQVEKMQIWQNATYR